MVIAALDVACFVQPSPMPWGPIVPFEASLCGWPKADCRPSFVVFGLKLARWAAATFCRLPSWCACPRWRPKLLTLASRPCSSDRKTGQPASARRVTVFSSACDALLARWARRDALSLAKLVFFFKMASQAPSALLRGARGDAYCHGVRRRVTSRRQRHDAELRCAARRSASRASWARAGSPSQVVAAGPGGAGPGPGLQVERASRAPVAPGPD